MTARQAKRAFALAAITLACVLAALTLVAGDGGKEDTTEQAQPTIALAPLDGDTAPTRRARDARPDAHGHDRRAGAPARRAARSVVDRFLRALLSYQAASPRRLWQADLIETAQRPIVRDLIAAPPRPPRPGPAPLGRVRSLEVHGPERGVIRASALIGYGRGGPSLIDLELRSRGAGWRVSRLYR